MNQLCLGIDIGTTNCCVGVYFEDIVHIIPNELGSKTTPSYMTYIDGEKVIGDNAKILIVNDPSNVVYDIKRVLGRKYDDHDVQKNIKFFSYLLEKDISGKPYVTLNRNESKMQLYPEEICASYFSKMKNISESYTNCTINNAVITVPAYFDDLQRNATKLSAEMAGLNILRIINEPTAAAIAYNLDKGKTNGTTLVFDLGGGTLDISILEYTNDENIYNVLATLGDMRLGGEDFDNKIYSYCLSEFSKKNKLDMDSINKLLFNAKCKAKLKKASEEAKKILSNKNRTEVYIDSFFEDTDLNVSLDRNKFEILCSQEFEKCRSLIINILDNIKLEKHMINDVVLVGGATRMPKIRDIIRDIFMKEPYCDIDPDVTVAYGASILGHSLSDNGCDNQIILIDVVPMTLGIETIGGIMTPIIEKNTQIPCCGEYIFSTYSDNQHTANLKVYQGNSGIVSDNILLDTIQLTGIRALPRGIPQIHIKFMVDINGILNVAAYEKISNIQKYVTIQSDPICKQNNLGITSDSQNRYDTLLWKYKFEYKLHGYKKYVDDNYDQEINNILIGYTSWYNNIGVAVCSQIYIEKINEMDNIFENYLSKN